ncbi:hypothetical protein BGX34_005343 [Mortierella sp. NVP85]|nr:hypothetical protein BGX34_005343 [Mortierella sp. NVP85]
MHALHFVARSNIVATPEMDTVTTTTHTLQPAVLSRESDLDQDSAIKPSLLGSDEAHILPKIEQPEARHPLNQAAIIALTEKADEIVTLRALELCIPNGTTGDQGKENHPPSRPKKRKKTNKKKKRQPQTHQDQAPIQQLSPLLPPSPAAQYPGSNQDLCHAEPQSHQNGSLLPSSYSTSPDNQERPSSPFSMYGKAFSSKSFAHILPLDTLSESIKAPADSLSLESPPDPTSPSSISPSSPTSMEPRQLFPRPRPPRTPQHIRRHSAPRLADGSTDASLVYSDVLEDYITTDSYEDEERERSEPSTSRTVSRTRGRAGRIHKLQMHLEEQQRLLMGEDANAREESEKAYAEKIEALERQYELRAEHYRCAVGAREKAAEIEQRLKSEHEHRRLDDLMREEARRLEEEEAKRLYEQEDAPMKLEEELNYTKFGDDDLDPDSDSRYRHIQSNGSLMSLAEEFENVHANDFEERSTDSDLTTEHSTESLSATTEDGGTLSQWDSLEDSIDTSPPPEQGPQLARFLLPIQPLQKPPNLHLTISGAPITTAIRDRHDYMQLVENTRRQNGFAIHYPGLLAQSCEPQQTPQSTQSRLTPPRLRGILGSLVSRLPYVILVLLFTNFALHPSSLDMVMSMFLYLRDDFIWNTRVDRSPTT